MIHSERRNALYAWIEKNIQSTHIEPIPGDASARHYFRVYVGEKSYIAVDSPPSQENNKAFVHIANTFLTYGLRVPEVLKVDFNEGFLWLSDLGNDQLLKILTATNVEQFYSKAMEELIKIQGCTVIEDWQLPSFDSQLLLTELHRFNDWFLTQHLNLELSLTDEEMLTDTYQLLIASATIQPQVCVHRDYHSRNLMLLANNELGILDFQDAVIGPITYDLVSLVKDCYIQWSEQQVYRWVEQFWLLLEKKTREQCGSFNHFIKWFDWMGLQRHLKVLGIFARLYLRDGKKSYLQDIPRILTYILSVCEKYIEFQPLKELIITRVLPYESNDFSSGTRQSDATAH